VVAGWVGYTEKAGEQEAKEVEEAEELKEEGESER
jgi:hypothetical protein